MTAQTVVRAYKFALDPTPRQVRMLASHAGGARFAYNWGNAQVIASLDARQAEKNASGEAATKVPSHFDLCKQWTRAKNTAVGCRRCRTLLAPGAIAAADLKRGHLIQVGAIYVPVASVTARDGEITVVAGIESRTRLIFGAADAVTVQGLWVTARDAVTECGLEGGGSAPHDPTIVSCGRCWQILHETSSGEWANASGSAACPEASTAGGVHDPSSEFMSWVGDNFVGTYQAALRDAAKAWSDFFASRSGKRAGRRLGRPRFKKKGKSRDSFQVHGGTLRMDGAVHVVLPKIGKVTVMSDDSLHPAMTRSRSRATPSAPRHMGNRRRSRTLWRALQRSSDQVRITRGTVSLGADGLWWLSLTAEIPSWVPGTPSRRQRAGGTVGVDFGVRQVATISDGTVIANPRYLAGALAELKAAQRALSRCQPGSARREKARKRVGLIHADVARMRARELHWATTALVRGHDVIAVEGWDVQQVMARGSKDTPRRVRRDRNRAMADAGIGMGREMLKYKGLRAAVTVMVTDPQAKTGRTCSADGKARTTPLPPHHEMFTSDQCGHVMDRRLNTALALAGWAAQELKRGLSHGGPPKPRGGNVRPEVGRKAGSGRSPVKRVASTRSRRGQADTPGP